MFHLTLNFKHPLFKSLMIASLLFSATLLNANASFPVNDYSPTENVIDKQQKKSKFKHFLKKVKQKFTRKGTKHFFKTQRKDNYNGTAAMWLFFLGLLLTLLQLLTVASIFLGISLIFALIGTGRDENSTRARNMLIAHLAFWLIIAFIFMSLLS